MEKRGFLIITIILVLSIIYAVHGVSYSVGPSTDFDDISACLFYINGSADSCMLNLTHTIYNMSSSQVWLSDLDLYNKNGMVIGYNLSDISDNLAKDASGLGHNGSIVGSPLNVSRLLNINSSAKFFDGKNDLINITGSQINTLFNFSQNFTFEAWILTNTTVLPQTLFSRKNDTFLSITTSGTINFGTRNTTTTELNECLTGTDILPDRWYHIAVTKNSTNKMIYINGALNKTCTWKHNLRYDNNSITIGALSNATQYFNGTLDEIAIYNRTLSASEIATHAWGHYNNYKFTDGAISFVTEVDIQTLDCSSKTLQGSLAGVGINIPQDASGDNSGNHTILNCILDSFNQGISSNSRDLVIKNTISKNNVAENIMIGVSDTDPEYRIYIENVTLTNSSTEDNIQANPNGLTNLTIIGMNASYSEKTCAVINSVYFKVINSYFYNSNADHCVTLAGNTLSSLFANNTLKYNRADDKFTLYVSSTVSLLIENNTFEENNLNFVSVGKNWIARNNILNATYELNYAGTGLGGNILLGGNSDNNRLIGNHIYNSAFNGIILSSVGGTPPTNNTITNNSIYNTSSGWDLRIASTDVYNTSVYLNNFYSKGVNNGSLRDLVSSESNFCVNSEGNFYEENIGSSGNKTYKGWNDCGQLNITQPDGGDSIINGSYRVQWTKQSSMNTINYSLYYRDANASGWTYFASTNSTNYLWSHSGLNESNDYLIKILPYDGFRNGTNDNSTSTFKIDNDGPSITLSPSADTSLNLGASKSISCTVSDSLGISSSSLTLDGSSFGICSNNVCSGTLVMGNTNSKTIKCDATDTSGRSSSKSITISSSGEAAAGGDGGGSGTGGGITSTTETITTSTEPVTVQPFTDTPFTISVQGTTYPVEVTSVTGTTATITTGTSSNTYTIGESKEVDINNDGVNDLEVTLSDINLGRAVFSIKEVEVSIPGEAGAEVGTEEETTAKKIPLGFIFGITVIISIILIGLYYTYYKKPHYRRR